MFCSMTDLYYDDPGDALSFIYNLEGALKSQLYRFN